MGGVAWDQMYRERRPASELGGHATSVFVQQVLAGAEPYTHRPVPNGSVELLCEVGAMPHVFGPQSGPLEHTLAPGTTVVGVRLRPGAAPPVLRAGRANCADARPTDPASYCPATNTITLDQNALARIGTPSRRGQGGGIGDFAAFGEVASRYALSVEKAVGLPLDDANAGLRTACLTGAWAGVAGQSRDPENTLRLSPGDLDEAIAELLADGSLIASDVNGTPVPAGYARVEAFRVGYLQGSGACTSKFG
jgi:hypothetical protein